MLQKLIADYCDANTNNLKRIAEACGVSGQTVRNWMGQHPCKSAKQIGVVLDVVEASDAQRKAVWAESFDVKPSDVLRVVGARND